MTIDDDTEWQFVVKLKDSDTSFAFSEDEIQSKNTFVELLTIVLNNGAVYNIPKENILYSARVLGRKWGT